MVKTKIETRIFKKNTPEEEEHIFITYTEDCYVNLKSDFISRIDSLTKLYKGQTMDKITLDMIRNDMDTILNDMYTEGYLFIKGTQPADTTDGWIRLQKEISSTSYQTNFD